MNGDRLLQNDDAVVDCLIDKVNCATGYLGAIVECLGLRIQTWESRKERRVNIENPVWKGLHKGRRDDAHVAGKTDEVYLVLMQPGDHLGVMFGALMAGGGNREGRKIELASGVESRRVFEI